jgi:sugar transferase (PEP-CTERM/EpsH1 system associated)
MNRARQAQIADSQDYFMGEFLRPDILCLTHRVPFPPDKGDRIRTFHVLRYLSARANVHLACLADEPVDAHAHAALKNLTKRFAIIPLRRWSRHLRAFGSLLVGRTASEGAFSAPGLRAVVGKWSRTMRFHAVLASASSLVPYLRLPALRDTPAVIDLMDVDSQKWLDYADATCGPRSWLYRLEGRRLRQLEQSLPSWSRAVTLVSEAEASLYHRFCVPGAVHAVSNGVDLDYFQPQPPATEPVCVFVGALDYRPNVDGAIWFCHQIWPEVRRRLPHARVALVGRNPAPGVCRLAEIEGVELVGQVPDVRPYLARASVAVVPLQIARGVQNKVLEAMAMEKAVVVSPPSLEGLGAKPDVHLVTATTIPEWIEAIPRLLMDPGLRQRLGTAARLYVEEHHRWDRCLKPFASLLGLPGGFDTQRESYDTSACTAGACR